MRLSFFQYRILQKIYFHPYIDYGVLEKSHLRKHIRFKNAIAFFFSNDLIIPVPFRSADEDTGQPHTFPKDSGSSRFIPSVHIILSEKGASLVEERIRSFLFFLVPYGITTFISLVALFR